MEPKKIRALLGRVREKECSVEAALTELAALPFSELDIAKIDHHRALRCGFAEVIYGSGKSAEDIARIFESALQHAPCVLATRVSPEKAAVVLRQFPAAVHNARAQTIRIGTPKKLKMRGDVVVVTAGTSDIPVAEEALETLHAFGCRAKSHYDVGVAGLHRVIKVLPELQAATAVICVAGMEGALPSVVGGLVSCPVIAVPTSVGYGASLNGITAMLSMLNTCASGVSVVNIDNGFGAAMCALRMVNTGLKTK